MPTETGYTCCHEELIQDHSLKITALETELNYKRERLDDLKRDNERMETKIDEIKDCVNEIILGSKKGDDRLDKRLLKIETRLETQEQMAKDNRDDFNLKIGIVAVVFAVLTFYFNYIHHL